MSGQSKYTTKLTAHYIPALGQAQQTKALPVFATKVLQLKGSSADQPMNGVALANTPEVIAFDTPSGKTNSWGIVSQTKPDTVLVPRFNLLRRVTAEGFMSGMAADGTQEATIKYAHPLGDDFADVLATHELSGVVADQTMTLANQSPVHYTANSLTLDDSQGTAVSKFTYKVNTLAQWRLMATHCWLRALAADAE